MAISGKEETALALSHRLTLEGRNKLSLTGVMEVGRFDEETVVLETSRGVLLIRGQELHVDALDLDRGELRLSGQVDSMAYEDSPSPGGFLTRLFR